MSGRGGHKHRVRALHSKKHRRAMKGNDNLARVRKQFEDKGQEWDPKNNPAQLAALNHLARRLVLRPEIKAH